MCIFIHHLKHRYSMRYGQHFLMYLLPIQKYLIKYPAGVITWQVGPYLYLLIFTPQLLPVLHPPGVDVGNLLLSKVFNRIMQINDDNDLVLAEP